MTNQNVITVNGKQFKLPEAVILNNAEAVDFYHVLNVVEVITGKEDFDRIDNEGGDYLESECFAAYAEAMKISEDDALIHQVSEATFAWFTDYNAEDYSLYMLIPV